MRVIATLRVDLDGVGRTVVPSSTRGERDRITAADASPVEDGCDFIRAWKNCTAGGEDDRLARRRSIRGQGVEAVVGRSRASVRGKPVARVVRIVVAVRVGGRAATGDRSHDYRNRRRGNRPTTDCDYGDVISRRGRG